MGKNKGAPTFVNLVDNDEEEDELTPSTKGTTNRANGAAADDDEAEILDLSNWDENAAFAQMPAGVHNAKIDTVELQTSQKGKKMIKWTFTVVNPDTGRNQKMWWYNVFDEYGLPNLKRALLRVAPEVNIRSFDPREANELIGGGERDCRLKVRHQKDKNTGEMRAAVQDVLAPTADTESLWGNMVDDDEDE